VFKTAREHLEPGGLFVFDAWFGPGVFSDPPTDRMKEVIKGNERIIRFAHPEIDVVKQVVTVHFRVLRFRGSELLEDVSEAHPMRPLFVQEVRAYGSLHGLDLLAPFTWTNLHVRPSIKDWVSMFVLIRKWE
jgi:hypothetical protein